MAFLGSFLQYLIIMIILVAIAVAGFMVGKALRKRKDAKDARLAEASASEAKGDISNE